MVNPASGKFPTFEATPDHRGQKYDQSVLDEQTRGTDNREIMYENMELDSDEMIGELWAGFEDTAEQMRVLRRDFAPGQHDYNDDYNQFNMRFNDRTVTGMDNCPRMKEAFVDMEYWIEEIIGSSLVINKEVKAYKGTTKKWQILDDDCHDREEIEKIQNAADAPLPE